MTRPRLPARNPGLGQIGSVTEADLDSRRRFYRRTIVEVLVFPRSAAHRLTLRWQGSDEPLPVAASGPAPPLP